MLISELRSFHSESTNISAFRFCRINLIINEKVIADKTNREGTMKAYQHILLTTDFSKFSEEVAKKAANLAGHFNAKITLLHVAEHFPEDMPADLVAPEDVDPTKYVMDQNRNQLEEFIKSIPNFSAIPMVSLSMHGAEDEIIKVAREIKADLIIIGSHGGNNFSVVPWVNADEVKQKAACDVLVVHAEAA